jgi:hypothetical protein
VAGRTQAVYYRDKTGKEPVNDFLEALLASNPRAAAKIDDYVEEYLNDRDTSAPPPEHPISSQVEGELRELRIRFARRDTGSCTGGPGSSSSCSTSARRTPTSSPRATESWP